MFCTTYVASDVSPNLCIAIIARQRQGRLANEARGREHMTFISHNTQSIRIYCNLLQVY